MSLPKRCATSSRRRNRKPHGGVRHTNVHLPQRKRPAIGCLIAPSTGGTVWRVAERSGGGTASTATIIRSGGYSGCDPDYNIACPPGIGTTAPEM
jgi:hypothetical protein